MTAGLWMVAGVIMLAPGLIIVAESSRAVARIARRRSPRPAPTLPIARLVRW